MELTRTLSARERERRALALTEAEYAAAEAAGVERELQSVLREAAALGHTLPLPEPEPEPEPEARAEPLLAEPEPEPEPQPQPQPAEHADVTEMRHVQCAVPEMYRLEQVDEWTAALQMEGLVVLRDFLAPAGRGELLEQFWTNFMRACHSRSDAVDGRLRAIQRDARDTWVSPDDLGRKSRHAPLHIAQSDFFWSLRTKPAVAAAFSAVHGVPAADLVTSLDSYSLHMRGHPAAGLRLHDDQTAGLDDRSEIYSVQGAYNFFGVGPEDTGFVAVPRSHYRWQRRRAVSAPSQPPARPLARAERVPVLACRGIPTGGIARGTLCRCVKTTRSSAPRTAPRAS